MKSIDPKYVASTRLINRRTATKPALRQQPVNSAARERVAAIKVRHRFGAPLAEQLYHSSHLKRPRTLSPWLILGSVLSAASTAALFLAWLQHSWALVAIAALGIPSGLGMIVYVRRTAESASQTDMLFEEGCLRALDRILEELPANVSDEIAVRLAEIKQQLIRIARLVPTLSVDENFTLEDRMYLIESVRRYLPDSLQSYLIVPQNQRTTQILEQGKTAQSLLVSQLDLLQAELTKQEMKLARSSAQSLIKQQRFLESKAKR